MNKAVNNLTGVQDDGSIVDANGNIITREERHEIIQCAKSLPARNNGIPEKLKEAIGNKNIIIIKGETGCGKTTQLPKLVKTFENGSIHVTSPRVLAAKATARRVAMELICETGDPKYTLGGKEVGYRTGKGTSSRKASSLSFNTAGTEVMRHMYSKLYPATLIVDEIQQFPISSEILMYIHRTNKDILLVLMSATIDIPLLLDYFDERESDIPVMFIEGRTFPVEKKYLPREGVNNTILDFAKNGDNTLVFCAGKGEIEDLAAELKKESGDDYEILVLHSELTGEEQNHIISSTSKKTRIILSTNVAEESITIPYIDAVVDFGEHKKIIYTQSGIPILAKENISKANSLQRAGRAGRTKPGKYVLHNDSLYNDFHDYPTAPIESEMLDKEILLFALNGEDLKTIVAEAKQRGKRAFVHDVNIHLLNVAYGRLQRIGALDEYDNITPLGRDILQISLDPSIARMLLEGIKRDVAPEMIYICAMLEEKSFLGKGTIWMDELKIGTRGKSDLITYIELFTMASSTSKELGTHYIDNLKRIAKLQNIDTIGDEELDEQFKEFEESKDLKLYEVIDLGFLSLKNHNIADLDRKIFMLQKQLSTGGLNFDISKKNISNIMKRGVFDNIAISITSGMPYYLFRYDSDQKGFIHDDKLGAREVDIFKKANISSVFANDGSYYIGKPFIIRNEENNSIEKGLEFFEESEQEEDNDNRMLSFITEIDESFLKRALDTQDGYLETILSRDFTKKKKTAKEYKFLQMKQVIEEYESLLSEIRADYSKEDFIKFILPLYLMHKNVGFKRRLFPKDSSPKQGPEVAELFERVSRFLAYNNQDYIHRIHITNLYKTEMSFRDDTKIWSDFRKWEKDNARRVKKIKQEQYLKKDDTSISFQSEQLCELFNAQEKYNTVLGRFTSSGIEKHSDILKGIQTKLGDNLSLNSTLFNNLVQSFLTNFENKDYSYDEENNKKRTIEETKKEKEKQRLKVLSDLNSAKNQKSSLNHIRTRLSYINTISSELEKCIKYCNDPIFEMYDTIDFEFLNTQFLGQEMTHYQKYNSLKDFDIRNEKKFFETKSQMDKFATSMSSVRKKYEETDPKNKKLKNKDFSIRKLNSLQRAETQLMRLLNRCNILKHEKEEDIQTIQRNIRNNIENIPFRKELNDFFSTLYNKPDFLSNIEPKINNIIKDIFTKNNRDINDIILNIIQNDISLNKLAKRRKSTKEIIEAHNIYTKIENLYNKTLSLKITENTDFHDTNNTDEIIDIAEQIDANTTEMLSLKGKLDSVLHTLI